MNAKRIKAAIKEFNRFLISAHINPEGDSIGSQIAIASLLRRLGKEAVILNDSPVPHILQFLKGTENILREIPSGFNYDAVIVLDCPFIARIGNISAHVTQDKAVINIDHHVSNENFGRFNWVATDLSSTGEMIFELFKAFKMKIEHDEAMAIYAAIMTDTGSFKYTNTSSRTHQIAAELIDGGVKPYELYSRIYETSSMQDVKLLGSSIQTLNSTDNGKVAWLWVTKEMLKETKASLEGTEQIINFARSIEGVEIAILFRKTGTEDRIKVSFRSKGRADVNKLASFFGGGGHFTASGCTVLGKMEDVEKKVLEKAREMVEDVRGLTSNNSTTLYGWDIGDK